ncbi:hypothetical protein TIFTF001_020372 [Ficus carica]|uniref:Alpha/beta hydrolase fold-3 domain-containing protein n=1 Tax=Ficus carica TaxID=3494 RepID=A0AA88D9S3_FICCA|nr:hypothetical protein TIFTF001_020372 [Ficus carica]
MAGKLAVVVVSVGYHLAPMHRLPAASDDSVVALNWIKSADDVWLRRFDDVSKCFLMGTCAGGNISYHAGLRASNAVDDFVPLKIGGLILHHPLFGGVQKAASELTI